MDLCDWLAQPSPIVLLQSRLLAIKSVRRKAEERQSGSPVEAGRSDLERLQLARPPLDVAKSDQLSFYYKMRHPNIWFSKNCWRQP